MDLHRITRRWHSPALFALIGLCFLLPFGTVSCDGATTTFTAAQLATWTVPEGGAVDGERLDAQVEEKGSSAALVMLVATALGFLLGVLRLPWGEGWCAAIGLCSVLYLGIEAAGSLATTLHEGFTWMLFLFAWAVVLHVVRAVRRRRAAALPAVASP